LKGEASLSGGEQSRSLPGQARKLPEARLTV